MKMLQSMHGMDFHGSREICLQSISRHSWELSWDSTLPNKQDGSVGNASRSEDGCKARTSHRRDKNEQRSENESEHSVFKRPLY